MIIKSFVTINKIIELNRNRLGKISTNDVKSISGKFKNNFLKLFLGIFYFIIIPDNFYFYNCMFYITLHLSYVYIIVFFLFNFY